MTPGPDGETADGMSRVARERPRRDGQPGLSGPAGLCGHRGEGRQRAQRAAPLKGVRFHIGLHHLAGCSCRSECPTSRSAGADSAQVLDESALGVTLVVRNTGSRAGPLDHVQEQDADDRERQDGAHPRSSLMVVRTCAAERPHRSDFQITSVSPACRVARALVKAGRPVCQHSFPYAVLLRDEGAPEASLRLPEGAGLNGRFPLHDRQPGQIIAGANGCTDLPRALRPGRHHAHRPDPRRAGSPPSPAPVPRSSSRRSSLVIVSVSPWSRSAGPT